MRCSRHKVAYASETVGCRGKHRDIWGIIVNTSNTFEIAFYIVVVYVVLRPFSDFVSILLSCNIYVIFVLP